MKIIPTIFNDVKIIALEKRGDERGYFARCFCQREMAKENLADNFVQINHSYSRDKGTLRGLHYQESPYREVKMVRCLRGALFDVIVDVRSESPTFGKHFSIELNANDGLMLYVPQGFAHGFLTLEDHSEVHYLVSEFYTPEAERGLLWNDPDLAIPWPFAPTVISTKDQNNSLLRSIPR